MSNITNFIVTAEWLNRHRTARGGWTACQLRALGEAWPPAKGWAARAVGRVIGEESRRLFESGTSPDNLKRVPLPGWTSPRTTERLGVNQVNRCASEPHQSRP